MNRVTTLQVLFVGMLGLAVTTTFAASISINNPGFESPVLTDGGYIYSSTSLDGGWTNNAVNTGNAGILNPSSVMYPGGSAPEGGNVGYVYSPASSFGYNNLTAQVLGTNPAAYTVYTLTVKVGGRLDIGNNGYIVRLGYGDSIGAFTLLAQDNNTLAVPGGGWVTATIVYSNRTTIAQPLQIQLVAIAGSGVGNQMNFDDVRLDAVSIPANTIIPEPIPIGNAGFETPVEDDGSYVQTTSASPTVPGVWTNNVGADANVFNAGILNPGTNSYPDGKAPEGNNIAYVYCSTSGGNTTDSILAQILGTNPVINTIYTLAVKVGSRVDAPNAGYIVRLGYGDSISNFTLLAQDDNSLSLSNGGWVTSIVSYTNLIVIDRPLQTQLVAKPGAGVGNQVNFDDVHLVCAPYFPPGAMIMIY